jgi:hypothetical protein
VLATAFRNTPHYKTDYFRNGANYHLEPPNINGQFPALHLNFYAEETLLVNMYDSAEQRLPEHILDGFDHVHFHYLQAMSEIDWTNHVDAAFFNCRHNDEEWTGLWMTIMPSLVNFESMFCSVCSCHLPEFYFTKSQPCMRRTRITCRHCETNCQVKIVQVNNWIMGGLNYFVGPQQCAVCCVQGLLEQT